LVLTKLIRGLPRDVLKVYTWGDIYSKPNLATKIGTSFKCTQEKYIFNTYSYFKQNHKYLLNLVTLCSKC